MEDTEISLQEVLSKHCQKLSNSTKEFDTELNELHKKITELNAKKQRMTSQLISSKNLLKSILSDEAHHIEQHIEHHHHHQQTSTLVDPVEEESDNYDDDDDDESIEEDKIKYTKEEKEKMFEKMYKLEMDYRSKKPPVSIFSHAKRIELYPEWNNFTKSDFNAYYKWAKLHKRSKNIFNPPNPPNHSTSPLSFLQKQQIYDQMIALETEWKLKNPNIKLPSNTRIEMLPDWGRLSKSDIGAYYAGRKKKQENLAAISLKPITE